MKTIIVDDEPKAIELLKNYLQHFSSIELVATFRNGLKAFNYLTKNNVDLIFLDINMPHISGISLSKMIDPKIKIIFTTAYSEYAVESYEVQAVDYLLKPISLERFTKTMSKIISLNNEHSNPQNEAIIFIKSGSSTHRIKASEILYLEKDGNYIYYHLKDQKIMARASIKVSLDALPSYFVQSHKSYIVNTKKVRSIDKESIYIDKKAIPIGASFKERFIKVFNKN